MISITKDKNTLDQTLIKSAAYCSVSTAILILTAKVYGWNATNSQSILASMVDSMLDISASLINLIVIHIVLQPPDCNHRFGHEKFQDIAVFSQTVFFAASSVFTATSSIRSLFLESNTIDQKIGLYTMYFSITLATLLIIYQSYVVAKTNSIMIRVDKIHYVADLLTNSVVVIAIYLSESYWFIDSLCGFIVSLYIFYGCCAFCKQAVRNLVDEEMPDSDRNKIISIVRKYSAVRGLHDLKTRYAANKPFIQFHLEMDGEMSLHNAHDISEQIVKELLTIFPKGDIIIHQDPADLEKYVNYREELSD